MPRSFPVHLNVYSPFPISVLRPYQFGTYPLGFFVPRQTYYLMNTVLKGHKEKHVSAHWQCCESGSEALALVLSCKICPKPVRPFNFLKFYTGSGHVDERIPNPHLTLKEML
jgi:hypothetical protein